MERYEKLYARIDEVFAGTPNTPAALSLKSEIVENLITRFDELRSEGCGEEEAIDRVIDSIGDLDELFGNRKTDAFGERRPVVSSAEEAEYAQSYIRPLTSEEQDGLWKRKKIRAFAVMLYILSIVPVAFIGPFVEGAMMASLAAMWIMWAGATALIIGAGAYTPGADGKKRWMIGGGVALYIFSFAPMFMMNFIWLSYVLMFLCWAVATMMLILAGGRKSSGVKVKYDKIAHKNDDGLDEDTRQIWKPINTLVTLVTLGVYLVFSFSTGGWAYSWLIWIIGGCIGDAIKALIVLICRKGGKR